MKGVSVKIEPHLYTEKINNNFKEQIQNGHKFFVEMLTGD